MSDGPIGGSPILREPADFVGSWRVEGGDGLCTIALAVERIESANANALTDASGCLGRLLGQRVAGWRVATDGIDMAGADRLSIGFFAFQSNGIATLSRGGRDYRLVRTR